MEPRIEICGRCAGRGTVHAASGEELAAARRAAGLSMRAMGALLGISKSYVNELEKEYRDAYPGIVDEWFSITRRVTNARKNR